MNVHSKTAGPGRTVTVTLPVEGMTCASCVGRVERALRAVPGVTSATVNLATERAEITTLGDGETAPLVAAIRNAGYGVPERPLTLAIDGMTCASCVGRVERALRAVPGVTSATVNLATEQAVVTGSAGTPALVAAIKAAGYDARAALPAGSGDPETLSPRADQEARLRRDLAFAAFLTLPVVMLEMGAHLFMPLHDLILRSIGMQASWLLQAMLTALVLAGPGRRFFLRGVPALWRGAPDMNSLVALGTSAAYGYSLLATLAPQALPPGTVAVYFEAAP